MVCSWDNPAPTTTRSVTDPAHSRQAIDALPHIVWVAGPDGAVEYVNRRAAEFAGLPLDDLLGWDWGWVIHPADLPETLAAWDRSVRTGVPFEVEYRIRRADGEYRWFLVKAEPVRAADGRVVRWFGTCTDVDESRRVADELRQVRALFRALVERSEDGAALVGPDGAVRYANPATERLLGFPPEELAGTDLWGSVHPHDRAEVGRWLERVVASPGLRLAVTVRFARPGGRPRWVEVLGTNLMPDPDVRAIAVQLRAVEGD